MTNRRWLPFALVAFSRSSMARSEIRLEEDDWKEATEYLVQHGGQVHAALEMVDIYGGRGIATTDYIAEGAILLQVPFELIISRKHLNGSSPSLAFGTEKQMPPVVAAIEKLGLTEKWQLEPDVWKNGPDVGVVVWMALERLRGNSSTFAPYLRMLQGDSIGHPCEIDSQAVANLTEDALLESLERQLPHTAPFFSADVIQYYKEVVKRVDPTLIEGLTIKRYMQAFYILLTRAFNVDGVRAILPVLCFVNHELNATGTHAQDTEGDNSIHLVASRDLQPGTEITIPYNLYGNHRLYNTYGFTVPRELESNYEWAWHDDLQRVYGVDYNALEPFTGEWDAIREILSYGVLALDLIKRVLQPKLNEIERQVASDPGVDYVEDACSMHKRRIRLSGELAVLRWKPVIVASLKLEALFGHEFAESVLSEGGAVTEMLFHSANKNFNFNSVAGKCSVTGDCADAFLYQY